MHNLSEVRIIKRQTRGYKIDPYTTLAATARQGFARYQLVDGLIVGIPLVPGLTWCSECSVFSELRVRSDSKFWGVNELREE